MGKRTDFMVPKAMILMMVAAVGCAAPASLDRSGVSSAVRAHEAGGPSTGRSAPRSSPTPAHSGDSSVSATADIVAVVNGRQVTRSRFVDLLVRSHGISILEQLIALEAVEEFAAGKGIALSAGDVERERDRTLRRIGNPLADIMPESDSFDRAKAEQALQTVMAQRNVSPPEFDIVLRRNALLRKMVESQRAFSEEELRTEFGRLYGPRVMVRHVQLATAGEAARCRERIESGEAFADVARRYSVNEVSAAAGGLLEPFSRLDERVPEPFREAAFSLAPGGLSDVVRVGEWHHVLRVESTMPGEERDFRASRSEVERVLRDRTSDAAMFALYEKLFRSATINVGDAALREEFLLRHPERAAPR